MISITIYIITLCVCLFLGCLIYYINILNKDFTDYKNLVDDHFYKLEKQIKALRDWCSKIDNEII